MESMESIRVEQPDINHVMIRHAEHAFMYVRQPAVIRGCVLVFMCLSVREKRQGQDSVCVC